MTTHSFISQPVRPPLTRRGCRGGVVCALGIGIAFGLPGSLQGQAAFQVPGPYVTSRSAVQTRPASSPATEPAEDRPEYYWDFGNPEVPAHTASPVVRFSGTRFPAGTATKPAESRPTLATGSLLHWEDAFKAALALAQQNGRPIIVRAGAAWCPWCRKLEGEIAKADVQKELARWTLVYVDTDLSPEEAEPLGIGPIPALRVLTPTGRLVASKDGYVDADALVAWLGKAYEQASVAAPDELGSETPPDAQMLARLLRQFDNRDPLLREAAIRRLAPHPDVSAAAVVNAFASGKLAVRLACLELLEAWKAPVDGLDPWQPQSISPARINALKEWAGKSGKTPATRPENLDGEQLAAAREELAAYSKAQSPAEVQAIRERLARYGLALLPEVLERLKAAATDAATERLSALRYRLAASDALALSWPGGFERLASLSAPTRQQAVEELTHQAGPADLPLLLELFGHPDPLVREIALRAMQAVGGSETTDALVKLLHDPEPNVRAAVLKQLAEKPNRQLVPQIAEYVKAEKDSDLVVHAVRFLREAKGTAAIDCLITLLSHESWRVRAEAAEAIGQCASDGRGISEEKKADVYVALIKLLDDPDGFVVSRAVEGLKGADLAAAMEPLARAAVNHPELASEISEMMSRSGSARSAGLSHLRKFITHQDAGVRAAAISGLASSDPYSIDKELLATLQDPESSVRIAAAGALLQVLEKYRPGERNERARSSFEDTVVVESRSGLLGRLFGGSRRVRVVVASQPTTHPEAESPRAAPELADSQPESRPSSRPSENALDPQSKWLLDFRAGRGRPEWMNALIGPLDKMLVAESVEERVAAAVPLIALGGEDRALPALMVESANVPAVRPKAVQAIAWLPWELRLELFNHLLGLEPAPEQMNELASAMAKVPDPRAAGPLWALLARPGFDESGLAADYEALQALYFGDRSRGPDSIPASRRKPAAAAARAQAQSGTPLQRLVGLALLLACDQDGAAEAARGILKDPVVSGDAQLRRDAGQILLLAGGRSNRAAVEAVSGDVPELRRMALISLAFGRSNLRMLRDRIPLPVAFDREEMIAYNATAPIQPEAPEGLKPEVVRPFLADGDPRTVACAGYLLALLGEAEGLGPLMSYWREHAKGDESCVRLVYRAIAALGDDAQVPVLDEIYGQMGKDDYRVRDFYWTIRIMKGQEALKLREKIRREVGVQRLR